MTTFKELQPLTSHIHNPATPLYRIGEQQPNAFDNLYRPEAEEPKEPPRAIIAANAASANIEIDRLHKPVGEGQETPGSNPNFTLNLANSTVYALTRLSGDQDKVEKSCNDAAKTWREIADADLAAARVGAETDKVKARETADTRINQKKQEMASIGFSDSSILRATHVAEQSARNKVHSETLKKLNDVVVHITTVRSEIDTLQRDSQDAGIISGIDEQLSQYDNALATLFESPRGQQGDEEAVAKRLEECNKKTQVIISKVRNRLYTGIVARDGSMVTQADCEAYIKDHERPALKRPKNGKAPHNEARDRVTEFWQKFAELNYRKTGEIKLGEAVDLLDLFDQVLSFRESSAQGRIQELEDEASTEEKARKAGIDANLHTQFTQKSGELAAFELTESQERDRTIAAITSELAQNERNYTDRSAELVNLEDEIKKGTSSVRVMIKARQDSISTQAERLRTLQGGIKTAYQNFVTNEQDLVLINQRLQAAVDTLQEVYRLRDAEKMSHPESSEATVATYTSANILDSFLVHNRDYLDQSDIAALNDPNSDATTFTGMAERVQAKMTDSAITLNRRSAELKVELVKTREEWLTTNLAILQKIVGAADIDLYSGSSKWVTPQGIAEELMARLNLKASPAGISWRGIVQAVKHKFNGGKTATVSSEHLGITAGVANVDEHKAIGAGRQ